LTNNAKIIVDEIDAVTEGMKPIEVAERPPHIQWGEVFLLWDDQKKLDYLMKFADSMNDAADRIQQERDELVKMLAFKEQQLEQMEASLEANNRMLQDEITKMNEYKQSVNKHTAELNKRIREIERGDDD